jgi:hypothetical protein
MKPFELIKTLVEIAEKNPDEDVQFQFQGKCSDCGKDIETEDIDVEVRKWHNGLYAKHRQSGITILLVGR